LEGELPDEELGRLLVATDFTEGDGSGAETMGLLDTTGGVLDDVIVSRMIEDEIRILTAAVLRAALDASCLRGALPEERRW